MMDQKLYKAIQEKIKAEVTIQAAKILGATQKFTKNEILAIKEEFKTIQGPIGPRGWIGEEGENGPQGPKGERGETGSTGTSGEQGIQGLIGPKGNEGPKGEPGIDGKPGKDGKPGIKGNDGPKGPKGDKGAIGPKGKDGRDGIPGIKGEKGDIGKSGPKGDKGERGLKGEKGDQGPQGKPGLNGKNGKDGKSVDENKIVSSLTKKLEKESSDSSSKSLAKLEKEFKDYKSKLQIQLGSLGGGGSSRILDMDDVEFGYSRNMSNNTMLIFDTSLGDEGKFKQLNILDVIEGIRADLEVQYDKLIDEANTSVTYIGERIPSSGNTASSVWRLRQIDEGTNPTTVLWANGSANTSFIWDNRASYTYTEL